MPHRLSGRGRRASEARRGLTPREVGHQRPDHIGAPHSLAPDEKATAEAREALRSVVGR